MSPARIVAVSQLLLDVLDDLADVELDNMGAAEADLAMLLIPHRQDLRLINELARLEMAALAPPMLAEGSPAAG